MESAAGTKYFFIDEIFFDCNQGWLCIASGFVGVRRYKWAWTLPIVVAIARRISFYKPMRLLIYNIHIILEPLVINRKKPLE